MTWLRSSCLSLIAISALGVACSKIEPPPARTPTGNDHGVTASDSVAVVHVPGSSSGLSAATDTTETPLVAQSSATAAPTLRAVATSDSGGTIAAQAVNYSASGTAVLAETPAASGATYGVRTKVASSNGTGMWALASAASGSTIGVRAEALSSEGKGVYARGGGESGNSFGVWGESTSSAGTGVFGLSLANGGTTMGIRGEVRSPEGVAALLDNAAGGKIVSARSSGVERLSIFG